VAAGAAAAANRSAKGSAPGLQRRRRAVLVARPLAHLDERRDGLCVVGAISEAAGQPRQRLLLAHQRPVAFGVAAVVLEALPGGPVLGCPDRAIELCIALRRTRFEAKAKPAGQRGPADAARVGGLAPTRASPDGRDDSLLRRGVQVRGATRSCDRRATIRDFRDRLSRDITGYEQVPGGPLSGLPGQTRVTTAFRP